MIKDYMVQRIAPTQYFEGEVPQENTTNYFPWLIFGGICIVAIVAIAIAYRK